MSSYCARLCWLATAIAGRRSGSIAYNAALAQGLARASSAGRSACSPGTLPPGQAGVALGLAEAAAFGINCSHEKVVITNMLGLRVPFCHAINGKHEPSGSCAPLRSPIAARKHKTTYPGHPSRITGDGPAAPLTVRLSPTNTRSAASRAVTKTAASLS